MRDLFPEYNKPSKRSFIKLWDEATFVFDTNVLLSLYRIPQQARAKLIIILKELQKRGRVWIPHQVALEYYRDRLYVIHSQEKAHHESISLLNTTEQEIDKLFDSKLILKKISLNFKTIQKEVVLSKNKYCDFLNKDKVEIELNRILKNRVGKPFDNKRLNEIYKDGEARYEKEIPPGYSDRKRKDKEDKTGTSKFGDLIIWMQILDKAQEAKTPIIFVTDEQKEDWWWKVSGLNGATIIGARHELLKEVKERANVSFHMYQSDQFMKYAGQHFKVKFNKDLLEKVKKLKESTQTDQELAKSEEGLVASSTDSIGSNNSPITVSDIQDQGDLSSGSVSSTEPKEDGGLGNNVT
ncbi:MAG: PIN domain-containing protein [Patescibacteria group bacterium]